MTTLVMSFNALTRAFCARIEALAKGQVSYYDAAELKKVSLLQGVKTLRGFRPNKVIIAIENETTRALVGPLSLAAALTRTRDIEVIWPDFRFERVSRAKAAQNIFLVARDTLRARQALARSRTATRTLKRAPIKRVSAQGNRLLYLDANISMGAPVGGSYGHTAGIIDGFLRHGFSVDYASLKPLPLERPRAAWLKLASPTLFAIPAELNYHPFARYLEKKIAEAHSVHPWSFIYQRFSLHNFSGALLGRRLNVPCVLEYNGSEVWAAEHWGTRLALHGDALRAEQAALGSADLIVTVSDVLGDELQSRGVPEDRILVYPNCVDPEVFDPARFSRADVEELRSHYSIPHDAFVVGFIGTFGQWHGVAFLSECIRDLARDEHAWLDRHKIHFLLVGDGLKMPQVRAILQEEGAANYVTLTGVVPQTDAPKHLAAADLLVAPHVPNADGTEFFGSPTKLFEYMAMARPILAASLGQMERVVSGQGGTRRGRLAPGSGAPCGMLFEPGDHGAFQRALRDLVENPTLAADLARAARAEVMARYTWSMHVQAILQRMADLHVSRRS